MSSTSNIKESTIEKIGKVHGNHVLKLTIFRTTFSTNHTTLQSSDQHSRSKVQQFPIFQCSRRDISTERGLELLWLLVKNVGVRAHANAQSFVSRNI